MNKIFLIGNLGNDPEIKEFENGGKIASFSLATTERGFTTKSGQEIPAQTQWHQIKVNGKMADVCKQYLQKGSKIHIEGIVRYRKWTDNSGTEKYSTEIHCKELHMLGTKPTEQNQQNQTVNENPFAGDDDDDNSLPF